MTDDVTYTCMFIICIQVLSVLTHHHHICIFIGSLAYSLANHAVLWLSKCYKCWSMYMWPFLISIQRRLYYKVDIQTKGTS